jgi:hypothetical protein
MFHEAARLQSLRLEIGLNGITPKGVRALIALRDAPELQKLRLQGPASRGLFSMKQKG